MKDKKIIFGIFLTFIFLASVGFSYAYFTSAITNKDVKDQIVETGTLSLRYVDGPEIVMNNIKPGATITKIVYVANTGTLDASYNLVWQELVNEITNDEMVIEATCTRLNGTTEEVDGTCENLESTPIKRIKIKENVSIEPNIVHKYDITITFEEVNADQNYNQGKNFNSVLGVEEYTTPEPIYCTFDGDLTQGAEYTSGEYTYHYMQEGYHNASHQGAFDWKNIDIEGWGVRVNTGGDITSKLCTYINDKPIVSTSLMIYGQNIKSIDLSNYNTKNIVNMAEMFGNANVGNNDLTINVSNFNTDKVTNMSNMFGNYNIKEIIGLSKLNTSNVTDMNNMFFANQATTLDLSNFDTTKVTNMAGMFQNSNIEKIDLSSFDTSKVTDMRNMFSESSATTINLKNFYTGNVTNMLRMFSISKVVELDLSNFDTSKVTDMSEMFMGSTNLNTIYVGDKFNTDNVTNSTNMFRNATNLVGGSGTKYNSSYEDKTYARVDGGTDLPGYFTLKTN